MEVQATGPAGPMGRVSLGQAGNKRVQSWGLHNGNLRGRKLIHRKRGLPSACCLQNKLFFRATVERGREEGMQESRF